MRLTCGVFVLRAGVILSFKYIHVLVGVLHVVLLTHYALHRLAVIVERAVEFAIIGQCVGGILDLGFQLVDALLLVDSAYEGVLIEKQYDRQYYQRGKQREREVTPAPVYKFAHRQNVSSVMMSFKVEC